MTAKPGVLPDLLLLLDEPLELSDNESSLELITDELSDSDELLKLSGPRYLIKLSFFVKSGGSANWDIGSTIELVLLGGDGRKSRSGDAIALADLFLAAGLPGPLSLGDVIFIGSSTGGWGDSVDSVGTFLDFGGLPGFFVVGVLIGGVLGVVTGLEHRELFFELKPFLLNSTLVRLFTPAGVVNDEPLSSVFDDEVDDSVVRELSDDRLFSKIYTIQGKKKCIIKWCYN